MDGTKNFQIQKTGVAQSPAGQGTDREDDNGNVNELALALVKRAIHAALKTLEGSNPLAGLEDCPIT